MKLWVDLINWIKTATFIGGKEKTSGLAFFTYLELCVWMISFSFFRISRLPWSVFRYLTSLSREMVRKFTYLVSHIVYYDAGFHLCCSDGVFDRGQRKRVNTGLGINGIDQLILFG